MLHLHQNFSSIALLHSKLGCRVTSCQEHYVDKRNAKQVEHPRSFHFILFRILLQVGSVFMKKCWHLNFTILIFSCRITTSIAQIMTTMACCCVSLTTPCLMLFHHHLQKELLMQSSTWLNHTMLQKTSKAQSMAAAKEGKCPRAVFCMNDQIKRTSGDLLKDPRKTKNLLSFLVTSQNHHAAACCRLLLSAVCGGVMITTNPHCNRRFQKCHAK